LDVTDADAATQVVHRIVEQHGRIDVLVNNAGFATRSKPGQADRIAGVYCYGEVFTLTGAWLG
jgi:NAD(P)-dependent dehydrogenase (short-subunit alcohol dehydrogenase family)